MEDFYVCSVFGFCLVDVFSLYFADEGRGVYDIVWQ